MKKLLIIAVALTFKFGASAQYGHMGALRYSYAPRVSIFGGVGPFSPYYTPFYSPYYMPHYGNSYRARPTKLDRQVADIKHDYDEKIWAAKHNKTLHGKGRRQEVRNLKHERDDALLEAKTNYYK